MSKASDYRDAEQRVKDSEPPMFQSEATSVNGYRKFVAQVDREGALVAGGELPFAEVVKFREWLADAFDS